MANNREIDTLRDMAANVLVQNGIFKQQINANTPVAIQEKMSAFIDQFVLEELESLLQAVVSGDLNAAEEIIKRNPELLEYTTTVTDCSGRLIENVTAFQAAIRAHDFEMWTMLEKYFECFVNGKRAKVKQFRMEFPSFNEKLPDAFLTRNTPYDFSSIVDVINQSSDTDINNALKNIANETAIFDVLNRFREEFTAISQKEKLYNAGHLLHAYSVYDNQYSVWRKNQRDLFWRQVIGYVQRYLPARYAQAFCQGVNFNQATRSFDFRVGGGSAFPLSEDSGLGFDFAVASAHACLYGHPRSPFGSEMFGFLVNRSVDELIDLGWKISKIIISEQHLTILYRVPGCTIS